MKHFDDLGQAFNWVMDKASGPVCVTVDERKEYWDCGKFEHYRLGELNPYRWVATFGGVRDPRKVFARLQNNGFIRAAAE